MLVLLQFHNLFEVGMERLARQAGGLSQDVVQVVGPQDEFPELRV